MACLPLFAVKYVPLPTPGPRHDPGELFLVLAVWNWVWYCAELTTVQVWALGIAPVVLARARGERGTFAVMPEPRAMARGLGTAVLCVFRIASNIVLLWLPGVVQVVRLFVAVPAAVGEGLPARDAALRSAQLVRGSGMRVFALLLLLRIVRTVLVTVSTFLAVAAMQEQRLRHLAL